MSESIRFATILSVLCLATLSGCTTFIEVEASDRDVISAARTWTFLKHDPPLPEPVDDAMSEFTYRVTSPLRNASNLDAEIAGHVTRALTQLGFEYVENDADLYVNYRLSLRPHQESVEVAFASNYIPSHSFEPSYVVEGSDVVVRDVEQLHLELDMREARGRVVWKGVYEETLRPREGLALGPNIDALIAGLPERTATSQR